MVSSALPQQELSDAWSNLLQAMREEKMFLASSLEFGRVAGLGGTTLTVAFPQQCNFYKETLERPENKKLIEEKAKEIFMRDLRIKFVLDKSQTMPVSEDQPQPAKSPKKAAAESIVQSALKIFHGRIIRRS